MCLSEKYIDHEGFGSCVLVTQKSAPTIPNRTALETAAADAMGTQTLSWSLSGLDPQCANVPRMMHDLETVGPVCFWCIFVLQIP